jgi:hypothetical protein
VCRLQYRTIVPAGRHEARNTHVCPWAPAGAVAGLQRRATLLKPAARDSQEHWIWPYDTGSQVYSPRLRVRVHCEARSLLIQLSVAAPRAVPLPEVVVGTVRVTQGVRSGQPRPYCWGGRLYAIIAIVGEVIDHLA